jgi:hypothetical protein
VLEGQGTKPSTYSTEQNTHELRASVTAHRGSASPLELCPTLRIASTINTV